MKFWPKIFFSIYFFPCFLNISVLLITDADARCSSFYLKAVGQDGFGGESLARIGLIATAVNEGFAYCHSPFYHLHHVGGHEEALENFLNLSGAAHVLFGRDQNCSSIRSKILLGEGLLPRKKFICREGKSIVVPCRYGSRGMAKNENCLNHTVSEHIVDDLMQTFSSLITADVLVLANSAFSYLAGIYNSGTVYYIYNKKGSFVGNRKPLPSWIALNLR
ncbi:unnamed protein product [Bathycoccus prasinos]